MSSTIISTTVRCNREDEVQACIKLGEFFMLPDEDVYEDVYQEAYRHACLITEFWKSEVKVPIPLELPYNNSLKDLAIRLNENLGGAYTSDLVPVLVRAKDATEEALQYATEGKRPNPSESESLSEIFWALGDAINISYTGPLVSNC